jgi:hypothetical protein
MQESLDEEVERGIKRRRTREHEEQSQDIHPRKRERLADELVELEEDELEELDEDQLERHERKHEHGYAGQGQEQRQEMELQVESSLDSVQMRIAEVCGQGIGYIRVCIHACVCAGITNVCSAD